MEDGTIQWQGLNLEQRERALLKTLMQFPDKVTEAAAAYSPAIIANYTYDLVKEFNTFYQNVSILGAKEAGLMDFRLALAELTGRVIKSSCTLLGIEVPDQM